MLNEWLLTLARWLDGFSWSTELHESLYMYAWIESTHVLTLMLFLGMLFIIDLRMLGVTFTSVPATTIAERLDRPMMIGFVVMVITGFILYFAIPVRSTQSIWFRIKVFLLIAAGINALLFRNKMRNPTGSWDLDPKPPKHIRTGAALSLTLWAAVVITGRTIAYDWYDCNKELPYFMYWAAGCVDEMAALDLQASLQ
ncbi:MAG: hypothetical protein QF921_05605 [Pseudomonadales bacterium]|nr:hypothetical protein [Pseudomonadales bacterium]MDP6471383.1 hypothetical protein [Pseudomonadales bacterium]MDP6826425.1 hypothetical protein [Pseudomonadales bacterium]MDP6970978.1 hypothetical protein [Pseudomonadales bacterium]